ncbi:MAG: hypothetical protein IPL03_13970 [Sterolibacteriaceae bacterium]|nr:hypothetical protein [Candidatus Methylophosphatis haderslevensis]
MARRLVRRGSGETAGQRPGVAAAPPPRFIDGHWNACAACSTQAAQV